MRALVPASLLLGLALAARAEEASDPAERSFAPAVAPGLPASGDAPAVSQPAAASPFPDPHAGAVLALRPGSLFRELPSSLDPWALLETVEPMGISDRIAGAGLYPATPARFSMRGSSWTQNAFVLDGLALADPLRGGGPLLVPDVEALAQIEVVTALAPASIGAPGVTLVARSATPLESWNGRLRLSGAPESPERAPDTPPAAVRLASLLDASALVSGPLRDPRWRLLLATRFARARRFEWRAPEVSQQDEARTGTLGLWWLRSAGERLQLSAALQGLERPLAGRARFGWTAEERTTAGGSFLRWQRRRGGAELSAHAGLWALSSEPRSRDAIDRPVDRVLDGPLLELVSPAASRRTLWSAGFEAGIAASALGLLTHAPRVGIAVEGSGSRERAGAAGAVAETVDGIPARLWSYSWGAPDSRRQALAVAAWASERLSWRETLELHAGLRLEHARGHARGGPAGPGWTSLLPRVSARARLTRFGGLALVGGYAEYQHRLLLQALAFGDPGALSADVHRWQDADGDGLFDGGEQGALVARAGAGAEPFATLDPSLRPPRTRELVAGLELTAAHGWRVGLLGTDRRERDLLEGANVGVTAGDHDVRYLPDPSGDILGPQDDQLLPVFERRPETFGLDRYLLVNLPGHRTHHQAVEVRIERPLGRRLLLLAGATASRTDTDGASRGFSVLENDPGPLGELGDDPNASLHARGRGFFDRAYTIKLAARTEVPGGVRAGVVARYQDGQPFARLVVVQGLAQGADYVQATPRGQTTPTGEIDPLGRALTGSGHRFTYTLTVDARLEKTLVAGRRRLGLALEAFNLLGLHHEVEERVVWGDRFREPVAVQPPRAVRLGASLGF